MLDTSVILYNHSAIYSFEDNDIAIPITVLEELDHFKKGNDIKNFEAREFIRIIDKLSTNHSLQKWIPIDEPNHGNFKVCMQENSTGLDATKIFGENTPDHRILNVVLSLSKEYPDNKIILVSKDINLRLKAKSLNIPAEDFETGKIKDLDSLYTGKTVIDGLPKDVIDNVYTNDFCTPSEIGLKDPIPNHYFIFEKRTVIGFGILQPGDTKNRTHSERIRLPHYAQECRTSICFACDYQSQCKTCHLARRRRYRKNTACARRRA